MLFPSWIYFCKRGNKPIYLKEHIFYLIYILCAIYICIYIYEYVLLLLYTFFPLYYRMVINYWHLTKTLPNNIMKHLLLCCHYRVAGRFVYTGGGNGELNYSMTLINVYVRAGTNVSVMGKFN